VAAPQPRPAAPAAAAKSPEATIDDVPAANRSFAIGLRDLVVELEKSEGGLQGPAKKALQDAKAKLPFVFGALRDGKIEDPLKELVLAFAQRIESGDVSGAGDIRRQCATHIGKCKDLILFVNYIHNAVRN
jgi:hypothetical protein